KDRDGVSLPEALAACDVDLDRAGRSRRQLENAAAYLELHIEQGPVLERLELPLGVVLGTFGVERHAVRFTGQSAHAGSTPVEAGRRLAAEERVEVEWERIWRIEPLPFDAELVEICAAAITEIVGHVHPLPSGPLHDAAEMVRAGVPSAMIFVQSLRGLSHTR